MGDKENENENKQENTDQDDANLIENTENKDAENTGKVYQMLWDCEYCGTKGLLGKDHRFCPACGSKQNPDKRYFPDEDSKVEVVNDDYIGADKTCPACNGATSAASTHCPGCGSPLEGASEVSKKTDPALAEQTTDQAAPKEGSKKKMGILAGIGILVLVGIFATLALIKKDINVIVTKHQWKTSVKIEKFKQSEKEGECSSKPSNAKNVVDYGEKQVNCRKEKVDRGDGTFKEKNVCDTEHRCAYTVEKWELDDTKTKTGGLSDTVIYPAVYVTGGTCIGCTREGTRSVTYKVHLKSTDDTDDDFTCGYSKPESWKMLEDGSTYKAKVNLLGSLDCDDIHN
ncbi:MAG: zinc ribbon domain-containing protein [Leptospirales bacterium]